jgi:GDPmannose 4,6-dehydratase
MLQGDASKAKRVLGWQPRHTFRDLVRIMAEADLELARREASAATERPGAAR